MQSSGISSLAGKSLEVAQAILDNAGPFHVTTDFVTDAPGAPGTVVDQNPRPGNKIEKGDNVILTVIGVPTPDDSGTPGPTPTLPGGGGGGGSGGVSVDSLTGAVRREN